MAKANLPVDFKDDILKENMNGKRRFNMIQNSDGTVSFEDVTDYTQVGSTFGAAQINATNTAVNNAADASKIIDSLETIKANTQSGYIVGALAAKELNSNLGKEISCNIRFVESNGSHGNSFFEIPSKKTLTVNITSMSFIGVYVYGDGTLLKNFTGTGSFTANVSAYSKIKITSYSRDTGGSGWGSAEGNYLLK